MVTAERREVSLQDVPASATVLNAAALAAQGVDNVIDIQQVAPSVAINTYNRSTFINIRGVGIGQSAPTSNPGVAYYIDGMFIPHEQFIAQSFFDIESIEVLRGPQGTLTGQNSTGGAIYVRTPAPQLRRVLGVYRPDGGATPTGTARRPPSTCRWGDVRACAFPASTTSGAASPTTSGRAAASPAAAAIRPARAALRFSAHRWRSRFDLRYEYFDRATDYNAIKNRNDARDLRSVHHRRGRRLVPEPEGRPRLSNT